MNLKMVVQTIGRMFMLLAALMVLPLVCAMIYGEWHTVTSFTYPILGSLVAGFALTRFVKVKNPVIYAKEGFAIVTLAWLTVSAVGALPFVISGGIPSYVDAFFETVSGLTTTGASLLENVEALDHGLLFWRSFTHWIGGMGVLVFIMAIVPNVSDRSIHILRAEMPGPVVGKLVPRLKDTAKILYLLYIALTVLEVIMLLLGGMPLFDSLVHSFGTAGTGGFGIRSDSIASYSPYLQWVIGVFMLLFGINFNLYYLILIGRVKEVFKSTELYVYLGIVLSATTIFTVNTYHLFNNLPETIRTAFFQTASLLTTTGYATTDFNQWPGLSRGLVFLLLFSGGCAGSTAGGLKLARVILLFKQSFRDFVRMAHPRSVKRIHMEGKSTDEATVAGVSSYFGLYMICILFCFLLLSLFDPQLDFETQLTASVSCFNNVGPGLSLVGPCGNYAMYSAWSKLVLSAAMLLGRLEIYPLILAFLPSTWRRER